GSSSASDIAHVLDLAVHGVQRESLAPPDDAHGLRARVCQLHVELARQLTRGIPEECDSALAVVRLAVLHSLSAPETYQALSPSRHHSAIVDAVDDYLIDPGLRMKLVLKLQIGWDLLIGSPVRQRSNDKSQLLGPCCTMRKIKAHTHVGVNAPGRPTTITDFSAVYFSRSIFSGGNPLCMPTEGS
ncbi:hypothetical protein THAOC_18359, partial [Thalassiosira oceanica]